MKVKNTLPPASMKVRADCDSLTSRAGTALLVGVADRVGLTAGLAGALSDLRIRRGRHEPGQVLRDLAVMLADGGDALCDLGALRDQEVLFGPVASDSTAWRLIAALDEEHLATVREARARARRRVWELTDPPTRLILDIDATLVTAHSEKEGAAGTYKHGFGFHPLLCFEATRARRSPGSCAPATPARTRPPTTSRCSPALLPQLPAGAVNPGTLVRCDSGGATHAFTDAVVAGRPLASRWASTSPSTCAVPSLRSRSPPGSRRSAQKAGSVTAPGSQNWTWISPPPAGRKAPAPSAGASGPTPERSSPSATRTATASRSSLTNQRGGRIARLEQLHRSRAAIEDAIRCAKASGLRNLPFRAFAHNAAWLELVLLGWDLVAFTTNLLLDGELATCEPKRLRYRLLHVAGRIVSHARRVTMRLPRRWPWADALVRAFTRLVCAA